MFAESLIESRARRWDIRRAAVLPLVVGIHLLILGALTVSSIWQITYLEEAPISVGIVPQIPRGIPGPSPQEGNSRGPHETNVPREPAPPTEIPAWEPVILNGTEEASEGPGGGVEGGINIWNGSGDPGFWGDPDGIFPGPIPTKPRVTEIFIADNISIMAPARRTILEPCYTEAARKARIEGTVILQLIIDKSGGVTSVKALRELPMGLTECAIEAAFKQRFRPAFRASSGDPVDCVFTLTIAFRLN